MIGRRLGHYEIVARLGEGGMGVVYSATDTHLDRLVAIKVLPPESVADPDRKQRFTREAKAASALNHPSIVTIYDIAQADGTDFIAMEYVQGKTLAELIGRKGLILKDTLNYAIQAASALAKAHAIGIVHRDLKPSNIMVTDDGLVKIVDFGVAKLTTAGDAEDDQSAATRTLSVRDQVKTGAGLVVGTAAYMSPEQAEAKKVDARSDIFSFGAVLYEMVTGARAFQGTTSALTLAAVVSKDPTPPGEVAKDVPRDFERIILRCLRKDPARRFQHMADLAVELEEIKTESGTQIAATTAPMRRPTGLWWVAAAAIVLVASAGAWRLWSTPNVSGPPATVLPVTSFPGDERLPTLSPDGNQVAFSWNGDKGANDDIYIMPVGSGTPVRLTTHPAHDSAPAWSPDGRQIAFLRLQGPVGTWSSDGRQMASFTSALYLMTPPVLDSETKLADVRPTVSGVNVATVSWVSGGESLLVAEQSADAQMNGIVMIPVGTREPRRLVWDPVSSGTYFYPAISPDRSTLAYALCTDLFTCDVYARDLAPDLRAGSPRRLTRQNAQVRGIAWSPDGRSVIYGSGGTVITFLWRVPLAGGEPERLELAGNQAAFPGTSLAGGRVAYQRLAAGADIWRFGPNTEPEDFLRSTLDDRNPQFSPDGSRIAFESRRLGKGSQLWLANANGTNPTPLTEGAEGVGGSPRWSPDSRRIVFDGQGPDGLFGIWVVDAVSGGHAKRITDRGALPSWSSRGEIYFNVNRTGLTEVWRIPAAGGKVEQVTHNGGSAPLESPDGTTLYFKRESDPGVLFAQPVGGGQERRVLESVAPGVHQYFPVEDGIYYISIPDPQLPFVREVRFFRFATGKYETLRRFEARTGLGLTVSKDRKTILYSGTKPSAGDDLLLIRDFR